MILLFTVKELYITVLVRGAESTQDLFAIWRAGKVLLEPTQIEQELSSVLDVLDIPRPAM